jgi:hypothetical protein
MALPDDVVKVLEGLCQNYVQNVTLYSMLPGGDDAYLCAHVYRANGTVEVKKPLRAVGELVMAEPFEVKSPYALRHFIKDCPPRSGCMGGIVVTYRGNLQPPMQFNQPEETSTMITVAVRKHFEGRVQGFGIHVPHQHDADEDDGLECTDLISQFSDYAWALLG